MSKKVNLAEEFLFDEKIPEEEFNNLQLSCDINDYCSINTIDINKYLTILKSNTLEYSKIPQHNYIKITQSYIVKKIILHNVPDTNYLLSFNGVNALTFKKIISNNEHKEYNDYYIDIENSSNSIIDECKSYCQYKSYINLMNINDIRITYPKNTNFNSEYIYYSLYGLKFNHISETYEEINTKYKYYINTINLFYSNPTYFINLYAKTIDINKQGNIYFYIDGVMIKNIVVTNNIENNFDVYRISFDDIHKNFKKTIGKQDKYLSSELALKTLNFTYINNIQIAFSNVIISDIIQFYYIVYLLPYMTQLFSD
jgi:hypothetical protein